MYKFINIVPRFLIISVALLISLNNSYAQSKYSKSGKPQDEAYCAMQAPQTRAADNKCIKEKNEFIGYEYVIELEFYVIEDYKKILGQYKSEEYLETLERSDICAKKGAKKDERNYQCLESKKIQTNNIQLLAQNCMDNSQSLVKTVIDSKIAAKMNPSFPAYGKDRGPDVQLGCSAVLTFQDKDAMCSISNKLLDHTTKENNKITGETFYIMYKRSFGSEVTRSITYKQGIADRLGQEFLKDAQLCKKTIDGIIAKKEGR